MNVMPLMRDRSGMLVMTAVAGLACGVHGGTTQQTHASVGQHGPSSIDGPNGLNEYGQALTEVDNPPLQIGARLMPASQSAMPKTLTRYPSGLADAVPMVVVGDPNGTPPVTPAQRVDPNLLTSPFSGVVSINAASAEHGSLICTGTVISDRHILTAAHCLDVVGGQLPDVGMSPTGDGLADFLASEVTVVFNENNPNSNIAGATLANVSNIALNPDWHGFNNKLGPEGAAINDDLAILTLSSPIPAGVPTYTRNTSDFTNPELLIMVGYGTTGDSVNGFTPNSADFFVKRTGQNVASAFQTDDEAPNSAREIFVFDNDGPNLVTDTLGDGGTIGNFFEATTGPGDSGGPVFLWNDDGDSIVQAPEIELFGVTTFGRDILGFPAPLYGSHAGGMVVSEYNAWINSVIPEPGSALALAGLSFLLIARRRETRWV